MNIVVVPAVNVKNRKIVRVSTGNMSKQFVY